MWLKLVELQPQTAGDAGGISREEFIAKIASDIQTKLPVLFDVDRIRKNIGEITPTTVVLLQELDRFNLLIKKMSTSLINLQRVCAFLLKLVAPISSREIDPLFNTKIAPSGGQNNDLLFSLGLESIVCPPDEM